MKNIHITLEDAEYEQIEKVKNGLTWHEFFMILATKEVVELAKKLKK